MIRGKNLFLLLRFLTATENERMSAVLKKIYIQSDFETEYSQII